MTAVRVITEHNELQGSGTVSHDQIDVHINTTPFVVVSGTLGNVPPSARTFKAGPGIVFTDDGPGGDLVVQVDPLYLSNQWVSNEIPTGSIDGVNPSFSLSYPPSPALSLHLYLNGVLQEEGSALEFVLSGSVITFASDNIPRTKDRLRATYQK